MKACSNSSSSSVWLLFAGDSFKIPFLKTAAQWALSIIELAPLAPAHMLWQHSGMHKKAITCQFYCAYFKLVHPFAWGDAGQWSLPVISDLCSNFFHFTGTLPVFVPFFCLILWHFWSDSIVRFCGHWQLVILTALYVSIGQKILISEIRIAVFWILKFILNFLS